MFSRHVIRPFVFARSYRAYAMIERKHTQPECVSCTNGVVETWYALCGHAESCAGEIAERSRAPSSLFLFFSALFFFPGTNRASSFAILVIENSSTELRRINLQFTTHLSLDHDYNSNDNSSTTRIHVRSSVLREMSLVLKNEGWTALNRELWCDYNLKLISRASSKTTRRNVYFILENLNPNPTKCTECHDAPVVHIYTHTYSYLDI